MKIRRINFDLDIALKIQDGMISGVIRTKGGYKATILATDLDNPKLPLAVRHYECADWNDNSIEYVDAYSKDGHYWDRSKECLPNDIVIDLWE